jgi:hypothetical protein
MTSSAKGGSAVRRLPSGAMDHEFYRERAHLERAAYVSDLVSANVPAAVPVFATTKRIVGIVGIAGAVAVAWFTALMLTVPPQTIAAETDLPTIAVHEIMRSAPNDLPTLEADAI